MTAPLSILIVEDEPLIAMMLEDFVDALGHRVACTVDNVEEALTQVGRGEADVTILDIHLRGVSSWPVADALADRGMKFVISTGGHVEEPPGRHAAAPLLSKPFTLEGVRSVLDATA